MAIAYPAQSVPDSKRGIRPMPTVAPTTPINEKTFILQSAGARRFVISRSFTTDIPYGVLEGPLTLPAGFVVTPANEPEEPEVSRFQSVAKICQEARAVDLPPTNVVESSSGSVGVLFGEGRRHAILECDADGDIVAMMTDRTTGDVAESWIVDPQDIQASLIRCRHFLLGR